MNHLTLEGGGRSLSLAQHPTEDALRFAIDTESKGMAILLYEDQEEILLAYLLERRDRRSGTDGVLC